MFFKKKTIRSKRGFLVVTFLMLLLDISFANKSYAAIVIPPSADASRFHQGKGIPSSEDFSYNIGDSVKSFVIPAQAMPENAKDIKFEFKKIELVDLTAYKCKDLVTIWDKDIDKTISLARVYEIAAQITAKYRADGYFLSRAYVPAQSIENGKIKIAIIEGYISILDFAGDLPENRDPLEVFCYKVTGQKPLNINTLERQILLLNDISDINFTAVLKAAPTKDARDQFQVHLIVKGERDKTKENKWVDTYLSYDNSGSRYMGPSVVNAQFKLLKGMPEFHQAMISLSATPELEELKAFAFEDAYPLNYDGLSLAISGGYTDGAPGYNLEVNEVESQTVMASIELKWAAIRSRVENLTFSTALDLTNSKIDALGTPLSEDRIRSASVKVHADNQDSFRGVTIIEGIIKQGLEILNSSEKGDADLSRDGGRPDFLLYEASLYRLQNIVGDLNVQMGVAGQFTTNKLLSSQQFGYGGKDFGRAYDSSEIIGDKGISAMIEIQYNRKVFSDQYQLQQFAFYDIGKVWNVDEGAAGQASGASAGFGVRVKTENNINTSLTVAQPLTRHVASPQMGLSNKAPRFLFSASVLF